MKKRMNTGSGQQLEKVSAIIGIVGILALCGLAFLMLRFQKGLTAAETEGKKTALAAEGINEIEDYAKSASEESERTNDRVDKLLKIGGVDRAQLLLASVGTELSEIFTGEGGIFETLITHSEINPVVTEDDSIFIPLTYQSAEKLPEQLAAIFEESENGVIRFYTDSADVKAVDYVLDKLTLIMEEQNRFLYAGFTDEEESEVEGKCEYSLFFGISGDYEETVIETEEWDEEWDAEWDEDEWENDTDGEIADDRLQAEIEKYFGQ